MIKPAFRSINCAEFRVHVVEARVADSGAREEAEDEEQHLVTSAAARCLGPAEGIAENASLNWCGL